MKIGFVGLGAMGHPMAQNLLKSGLDLIVFDVMPEAVSRMQRDGATVAASIAEMASKVDVIIMSVQTGQQVSEICLGEQGIFANAKSNLLLIDCSSIDIATTQALHQKAGQFNIAMIDAPVSGGVAAATAATLTVMVGGTVENYQRALPILQKIGKRVIHAGASGHGQAAKICNNLLLAISMIGVSEAFTLAKKLGLDQKTFFDISSNASGQCWSMTSYCPVPNIIENVPANRDYQPGFKATMMLKDLKLGQLAASQVNASIPLGAAATELYELFVNQGMGDRDFSAIIQMLDNSSTKDDM